MDGFHNPREPRVFSSQESDNLFTVGARLIIFALFFIGFLAGFFSAKAFGQESAVAPALPPSWSDESLTAFMVQIYSQGLALKMAQADRCIRKHRFAALTVHDNCLYEVSTFNGPFPQFRLCRDVRGEPVCGGRR